MEVDYQRALGLALPKSPLEHLCEAEIPIYYDGVEVTRRRVDFVIWDSVHTVLLEIKAAKAIRPEDVVACHLRGLRASWLRGPSCLRDPNAAYRHAISTRLIHSPSRKGAPPCNANIPSSS